MPPNHFSVLKQKLQSRHEDIKGRLASRHQEAFDWLSSNAKQLAAGTMGSLLLLSSQTAPLLSDGHQKTHNEQFMKVPEGLFAVSELQQYIPDTIDVLSKNQEDRIAEILSNYYGVSAKSDINGLRLKHTYGYIGAEQNLMRYPGDQVENMAPGRGAWGYFARSKEELTQKDIDREKYYIAVQTFLAPDYIQRLSEYRDFFKFRKMLVVNPNTGKAMVVVIGDAGPAVWTGKQLGGSPEVMKYLERVDGKGKGPVLYFFIDDPEDKIPLGPIEPKKQLLANN